MEQQNTSNTEIQPQQRREPVLAGILSFLFIGLGQAYNGQRPKGYIFFGSMPALVVIYFILHALFNEPMPQKGEELTFSSPSYLIVSIAYFFLWLFNIYDAYQSANKINAGDQAADSTPGRSAFIFIRTVILSFIAMIITLIVGAILIAVLFRR